MNLKYFTLALLSVAALSVISCRSVKTMPVRPDCRLVILHTNDTHSQLEPDRHNHGGIARRKVLVDSVRATRPNVILVDAGDAVQGSLYYTLFDGEVERVMMNEMGYDIRILGNHEFDKGLPLLAREWSLINGHRLSTNYDFSGTALEGLFERSVIVPVGGYKVGFIGINLDPKGIVFDHNYKGITYSPAIEAASTEATELRRQGAHFVVAVTHIGYEEDDSTRPDDRMLARESSGIDLIIGGHSHQVVTPSDDDDAPRWTFTNRDGRPVTVVQTGATGINLGHIEIDLNTFAVTPSLIPVDSRLDDRIDTEFASLLLPYRHGVDSVRALKVGYAPSTMLRKSPQLLNFFSDYVKRQAAEYYTSGPIDLAIMNKGGLRADLPAGDITRGSVIDIAPFDNSIVVLSIPGSALLENFRIMAREEGQGISDNVRAAFDDDKNLLYVTIDGIPIDPDRTYTLATIDYLALGGDYMEPLLKGTIIARSPGLLHSTLSDAIAAGKVDDLLASPSTEVRFREIDD